jgi:hypothetical protein
LLLLLLLLLLLQTPQICRRDCLPQHAVHADLEAGKWKRNYRSRRAA